MLLAPTWSYGRVGYKAKTTEKNGTTPKSLCEHYNSDNIKNKQKKTLLVTST